MTTEGNERSINSGGVSGLAETSNPLYMHPSDSPGASLVPVPFDGGGYRSWRRSVLRALLAKNKLGFVNGECKKPEPNLSQFWLWERCDNMVTSWILNSLSKEISDSMEYVNDSIELWRELEDRYGQTNGAKLYKIQKKINDLTQGNLDITAYYTKIKKLWEKLNTLSNKSHCICACVCGPKENGHKAEQDRRLIQFLMCLNEVYTVVRESILMMTPLPSMAQAFSILIQEEKHREFKPSNVLNMEFTSLNASSFGTRNFRTTCPSNRGPIRSFNGNLGISLRTYNPNHKFNKGKRAVANVHGMPTNTIFDKGENAEEKEDSKVISMSKEQYQNVMTMLHNFQVNAGENANNSSVGNGSVSFAAPLMKRPQEIGEYRDGLYFLCSRCLKGRSATSTTNSYMSCVCTSNSVTNSQASVLHSSHSFHSQPDVHNSISNNKNEHPISVLIPHSSHSNNIDLLWHNRLGHVPFAKVRTLTSIPIYGGPTMYPPMDNYKYFITMVDDYSRSTWTHLLSCKNNALQVIKAFLSMIENQFETTLKIIRSDNGLEFINNEAASYFQSKGYPFGSKGYKVISLATRKIHVSKDVVFHENVFPFASTPKEASFDFASQFFLHSIPSGHSNFSPKPTDYDDVFVPASCSNDQENVTVTKPTSNSPANHISNTIKEAIPLRKSRTHKTPTYLKDYHCPSITPTSEQITSLSLNALFLKNRHITQVRLSWNLHEPVHMQDPREPHLQAVFHLLRYIKKDPTLEIFLSNSPNFCDSDWASCPDSRRSVSAEAEYRSLRKVVGELVWLSRLLEELIVSAPKPYAVFCDNQSALHFTKNPVFHERTKHIEVDCHFIRNKLQEGLVSLHHVATADQLADVLTKALMGVKHSAVLGKLDHGIENNTEAYYKKMLTAYPGNALLLANYARFLKEVIVHEK
ncbi:uncharacterized protein LOC124899595 [Capsicum annuum]|uniref:uncharacterized protein LOC124899595 n=1 Tax=Capsicum annuum TaxID=4072 RepID=UPI001FB18F54|nr:uncharacterized protein LOC124899595 [Capsicum annuum]